MQAAVIELQHRSRGCPAIRVDCKEGRFGVRDQLEGHVRVVEIVIHGLTPAECERIGKRVWNINMSGREIVELLTCLRTFFSEHDLTRLKVRLQPGDEAQLTFRGFDRSYGD